MRIVVATGCISMGLGFIALASWALFHIPANSANITSIGCSLIIMASVGAIGIACGVCCALEGNTTRRGYRVRR